MLYWLPAIFILTELTYLSLLSKLLSYFNASLLYQKYSDESLAIYIKEKYFGYDKITLVLVFIIIFQSVYFLVGLFHSIWLFSLVFFLFQIISIIKSNLSKKATIEKIIKRAKLEDFEATDIKLSRLLKLNEIKNIKTNNWLLYIYPVVKILAFMAIIILHYHFNLI